MKRKEGQVMYEWSFSATAEAVIGAALAIAVVVLVFV